MGSPRQAIEPEVVQVRADYWGHQVFVLGICAALAPDSGELRTQLLTLKSAGACSFSAEYDVEAGRYLWFRFNGRELREPTGDAHWHQVRGGDWWVEPSTIAALRAQVQTATAGHPQPEPVVSIVPESSAPDGPARPAPYEPESNGPPSFIVQFQGRMLDGRRVVVLTGNCFDNPFGRDMLDWRMSDVLDGGDCVFEATFDPARGILERFAFHGVA